MISRYTGIDADGVAESEADHFMKCPECDDWFDMRDLGQVLAHIHAAKRYQLDQLLQNSPLQVGWTETAT